MDSILITGVNGFIGGAIATNLNASGSYHIFGTDIQESPDSRGTFGGDYFPADITNQNSINDLRKFIKKCDVVVHAAAQINCASDLLDVNVNGTYNIAQMSAGLGARQLIYISSIQVIGRPPSTTIFENEEVTPLTIYQASKYFGERLLMLPEFADICPIIWRIASPVGPKMPECTILKTFLAQCLKGKPLMIYGSGSRIQNYIDVRDIARAVCLAGKALPHPGIYNISGTSISNIDLARLCIDVAGFDSEILFSDRPDPEEYNRWIISGEKARDAFTFEPEIPLAQSILEIYRSLGDDVS